MKNKLSTEEILKNTVGLTDFEKNEVWEYNKYGIYYIRKKHISYPADTSVESFTDARGYYKIKIGDHLLYRYEILRVIGNGSFGTVVKVYDHKDDRILAVKVERNIENVSLRNEYMFMRALQNRFPDKKEYILQVFSFFSFRNHSCLVEEILGSDLEKRLNINPTGLPSNTVKELILSALNGLYLFHKVGIIHADLKPGNIAHSEFNKNRIKIIDFSSSHLYQENHPAEYMQTRTYRAPEVILRNMYDTAIDMWSLGCVTAELLLGQPLLYGFDEVDQFSTIIEMLGLPPEKMMRHNKLSKEILNDDGSLNMSVYNRHVERYLPGERSLHALFDDIATPDLIDFMEKCLTWNPSDRLTPSEALKHRCFRPKRFKIGEIFTGFVMIIIALFFLAVLIYKYY